MLETLRTKRLKHNLASSLERDAHQVSGWREWLASSASRQELFQRCPDPGWSLHLAFWTDVPQSILYNGAVASAQVAMRQLPGEEMPFLPDDWKKIARPWTSDIPERLAIAARIAPSSDGKGTVDRREAVRIALWSLTMASVHLDSGNREMVAHATGLAVGILSQLVPEARTAMLQAQREVFARPEERRL